jgi:hypothetical protein
VLQKLKENRKLIIGYTISLLSGALYSWISVSFDEPFGRSIIFGLMFGLIIYSFFTEPSEKEN